jgi:hypothetical protein
MEGWSYGLAGIAAIVSAIPVGIGADAAAGGGAALPKGQAIAIGKTVRTCQQLANQKQALWTFLEHPGIEPTNNAAVDEVFSAGVRALRPAVIQRKITGLPSNSRGVQSAKGALCRSRLLTVTTTLRQQGRDVWDFLEQAWIAHHHGGVMPSLLPDP